MAYLDVSPMMVALRTTPEEFELSHGWLHHTPSRHSFKFSPGGGIQLRAECNCSLLAIKSEQEEALTACYYEWQANYWRPLQINREFASHFRQRSPFRQLLIDLTARVHRWLLRQGHASHPAGVMHPAE